MGSYTGSAAIDKGALERDMASSEVRAKLSARDRSVWEALRWTVRPYVYYDKILIAWAYTKGRPEILDVFTVESIECSFQQGMWARLRSEQLGEQVIVTHTPRRLSPELRIFAWLPFFNEVRFHGPDWHNPNSPKNLRVSMCFKMPMSPKEPLREGVHYISEMHTFREQWPEYSTTRF
jgi:hypothetical protein